MKQVYTALRFFEHYGLEQCRRMLAEAGVRLIVSTGAAPVGPRELERLLPELDGMIVSAEQLDEAFFQRAKKLRIAARFGVGYDNVDIHAAKRYGVACTNIRCFELARGVAELALGLILSCLWNIPMQNRLMARDKQWQFTPSLLLTGKTVGLVGFGDISRELAKLLAGFGCRLVCSSNHDNRERMAALGMEQLSFEELLAQSHVVSIHTPATPENHHLFGKDAFERMRPGAVLVNTARGALVDEQALYEALRTGRLLACGSDVFEQEPTDLLRPLFELPNFVAMPHLGGASRETAEAESLIIAQQVIDALAGREPAFLLNP